MNINESEKHTHMKWLGWNVCPRSSESKIESTRADPFLYIRLTRILKGKRKTASNLCILKADKKIYRSRVMPFFWEFRESWRIKKDEENGGNLYKLENFIIKLTDLDEREIISIHWELMDTQTEKYQPHFHINWKETGINYVKIHFPINHGWNRYNPKSINSYHGWLGGVLNFLSCEFPRCLKSY